MSAGRAADSGTVASPAALAAEVRRTPEVSRFVARRDVLVVDAAEGRLKAGGAFVRVYVGEQHRRHGAGRSHTRLLVDWARDGGVKRLTATVVAASPGELFAAALGARTRIRLVTLERRRTDPVTDVARPPRVELVTWSGRCPDRLAPGYARLKRHIADAPDAHLQLD